MAKTTTYQIKDNKILYCIIFGIILLLFSPFLIHGLNAMENIAEKFENVATAIENQNAPTTAGNVSRNVVQCTTGETNS